MAETKNTAPTVQDMLSEWLAGAGFKAMADDVLAETDPARLRLYARLVLKNCVPADKRQHVYSRFVMLRLA